MGGRVVEVKGFTGAVNLDDIAQKISTTAKQRSEADALKLAERITGMTIVTKLKSFYREADLQSQNSYFFTRFLFLIRHFSFTPYTARFYTEFFTDGLFRGFSKNKFLEQFGGSFNELDEHPASDGSFGFPVRIMAQEGQIRALSVRV